MGTGRSRRRRWTRLTIVGREGHAGEPPSRSRRKGPQGADTHFSRFGSLGRFWMHVPRKRNATGPGRKSPYRSGLPCPRRCSRRGSSRQAQGDAHGTRGPRTAANSSRASGACQWRLLPRRRVGAPGACQPLRGLLVFKKGPQEKLRSLWQDAQSSMVGGMNSRRKDLGAGRLF